MDDRDEAGAMIATGPGLIAAMPAREGRVASVTLLVVSLMLAACCWLSGPAAGTIGPVNQARHTYSDSRFYHDVVADVRAGRDYYASVLGELASHGRSISPTLVVRPPTLAEFMAHAGPGASAAVHMLLALAAAAALWTRLHAMQRSTAFGLCAALAIAAGWHPSQTTVAAPMMHEQWAGLLCVLSLAARTERRHAASIALALAAVALRETALSLVATMLLMAALERRRRETGAWTAALAACAVAGAWHVHQYQAAVQEVAATTAPLWWGGGMGIGFFASATVFSTTLERLPLALGGLLAAAGLIGWLSRTDPFSRRVTLHLAVWAAVMAIVARAENFYWTPMYAMLVPAGLLFLPTLARDAARAFRGTGPNAV